MNSDNSVTVKREYNPGDVFCGFRVVRVRDSAEIGGRFVEFVHEKTGAELVFVDNGEENKLFCIAFKTLPEDSTGVFHILEHSVLCGSETYPVKEPFVELLKSSMNTFLNAMTFQDKTIYPVSSRNAKDFLNLTGVYLDAVFRPAILKNPNIFYQEGRHIEQAEDGTLSYKGVVFNEMKGALSSVDDLVGEKMLELLYPGSPYGVNSGGDPEHIPDLTYEQFIATYKKCYHPSNSRIYVDGDIPFIETLTLIDSYLAPFGRGEKLADPPLCVPAARTERIKYELPENEPVQDRNIYTFGRILGTWEDKVRCMAADVLGDVLLGSNFSPLKSRVLESGLAQDIYSYVDTSVLQPAVYVQCRNVKDGKENELRELIARTAEELAETGIDREQLLASLARFEFHAREQEEPRALRRVIMGLNSWLHDGDPLRYIEFDEDIKALRGMLDGDGFEQLTREIFVKREGSAELLAEADHHAGEEQRKREAERLAKVQAGWTPEDRAANAKLNEELVRWQQTPDSPEAIDTIPVLSLSEIKTEIKQVPTEEVCIDGVAVRKHTVPCHGICHFTLNFDISDFTLEELTVLSRALMFYGTLPTEKHDALELMREQRKILGRFTVEIVPRGRYDKLDACKATLKVSASALCPDYERAVELVREILTETRFDDHPRMKEMALQNDEGVKQMAVNSGHAIGIRETMAHYSASGAITEAIAGRSMILYSHKLAGDFDAALPELKRVIGKLRDRIDARRLTLMTAAAEDIDAALIVNAFKNTGSADLPEAPGLTAYRAEIPDRMGITIPAQIGFAVQGFSFQAVGFDSTGSIAAATQIASLDFLWNEVRVQGGAYGAGIIANIAGNVFTYSYRDPSPAGSLEVNQRIAAYLREFCASGWPLDKYIISAVSEGEPLLSPRNMAAESDNNWYTGLTREVLEKRRAELISTSYDDILHFCDILDRFAAEGTVCVVAYKDALDKCEGLTAAEI
ncbi:MAG: insulinase family protein [Clostridia bacterium]|nr:insulinase family protein [Clostridia bacterium]